MAVPAFVGVADDRNGSPQGTGSLALSVPPGASGDLLVAVVGVKVNPSTTNPSGWTPIIAGFNGCVSASDPQIGIRAQLSAWWKISDGTETSVSVTFGAGVIRQASGGVLRYSGADPTNPIGGQGCDKGTSTTPTAPSITTTTADNRIVRLVVSDTDDADGEYTAEPATKRFEIPSTSVFGPGSSYTEDAVVTAASDAEQPSAGPTGTASWTLPATDQWASMTVAIQPAGVTDAQEGCLAAIIALIRKILEAIIDAIKKAIEALVGWIKGLLGRRKKNGDD